MLQGDEVKQHEKEECSDGVRGWRGGLLFVLLLMGSWEAPHQGFAKHECSFLLNKALPAF